ncbi:hypothetical protein BCR33DRAFT_718455 [Rhizoclosmatium globosum]|uniref:Uncharacterized protein n=1 Tax=Rhizoclosmatium globosum TaxID=329046 RepID=A0A1Y2C5G5_9FUNG|nr:hypothetical protein BCR33DRAFT_718455 [Rhizoclosmatium globosum]|eukprot:ORY42278.1 hypothetical protein BCR33DRAFT_718455 [Rhizoclosmatium globosum]
MSSTPTNQSKPPQFQRPAALFTTPSSKPGQPSQVSYSPRTHSQNGQPIQSHTYTDQEQTINQLKEMIMQKTAECERLKAQLSSNRSDATFSTPTRLPNATTVPERETELDYSIAELLVSLKREVEEKSEAIKLLQQKLQATAFTTESVAGKRLTSLVSLLEVENKALLSHLSEDSRVEYLQAQLAHMRVENLALRCKLQETEVLAESLDAELEKNSKV